MKGLLVKDLLTFLQRKRMLAIMLILSVYLGFTMDLSFMIGYIVMFGVLFALSTLSYDEYDNSIQFIMTLPSTRKQFAVEKHVFCWLIGIACWILGVVIEVPLIIYKTHQFVFAENVGIFCSVLPIIFLMPSLVMPFQLKYGVEKSRIVLFLGAGFFFAAIVSFRALIDKVDFTPIGMILDFLDTHLALSVVTGVAVIALLTVASLLWSIRIVEKMEF